MPMEIWDLYDKDRNLTGETGVRGEPLPEGRYHLVVEALFLNSKGETLLQRRAKEKDILPDIWSVTGGSAVAGEDSFTACVREVEEEMGFTPDTSRARLLMTERRERPERGFFRDVWLFYQDVPIESMTWQPGEVQDGMWIMPEKIKKDPALWRDLNQMYFWPQAYPYLCLESMRVRIPKGIYRHYKGNRYEAQGLALHSETLEPMVIYKALYGPGEIWTRPASMWNEEVTLPDGSKVLRFRRESL
ncbi:MAG: DUF1653 domain-containing protein [Clostridia bacterium]|nr:DUF1653 domain-containing protein [Clostridia bacterium]